VSVQVQVISNCRNVAERRLRERFQVRGMHRELLRAPELFRAFQSFSDLLTRSRDYSRLLVDFPKNVLKVNSAGLES